MAMSFRRCFWLAAGLSSILSIPACSWYHGRVQLGEELLGASGFRPYYPMDGTEQANLKRIPQRQLLVDRKAAKPTYLYADDSICDCLFMGNQAAYDKLLQLGRTQENTDETFRAAELREAQSLRYGGGWGSQGF